MREYELYPPVRDWLVSQGWKIHVELFDGDIVAERDGELMAVELKPCLTSKLVMQLVKRAEWADYVMAAVASRPDTHSMNLSNMRYCGFGLLEVSSRVKQRFAAKRQPYFWHKKHTYRVKRILSRNPAQSHELAGLPACPALRLQRQQRAG